MKFDEVMKAESGYVSIFEVQIKVNVSDTSINLSDVIKKSSPAPVLLEKINVKEDSIWRSATPPKINMGDKRSDGTQLPRSDGSDPNKWVRITPSKSFKANTTYYVLMDSGAFKTVGGASFSMENEATWIFTTGTGSSSVTTIPGATTTVPVPAATCPGITFPGRAPRQRIDAVQSQFANKALACSISLITRSKLIAVAISSSGTLANPTVASYTVRASRIGGSFLTKPVSLIAGPSVQRTQFSPLKTGSWTVTVTALGPTGAVVAEWTSAAFPVRP